MTLSLANILGFAGNRFVIGSSKCRILSCVSGLMQCEYKFDCKDISEGKEICGGIKSLYLISSSLALV